MEKRLKNKKTLQYIQISIIAIFCVFMLVLEFVRFNIFEDLFYNQMLLKILQQTCGICVVYFLLKRLNIKLFRKPENLLYLLPCLVIVLDNFPLCSYLNGNMQIVRSNPLDVLVFAIYCLFIGIFEEGVFRGLMFGVLLASFSKDRKGLLKTYFISSLIFGGAHLFNIFSGGGIGATLLQVCYTILTGGLFAFALLKTKNILCCGVIHGLYNFCGLLLAENGLGTGIVFDIPTVIMMTVISVIIGVFVLLSVIKYNDKERLELYRRFDIKVKKDYEE